MTICLGRTAILKITTVILPNEGTVEDILRVAVSRLYLVSTVGVTFITW